MTRIKLTILSGLLIVVGSAAMGLSIGALLAFGAREDVARGAAVGAACGEGVSLCLLPAIGTLTAWIEKSLGEQK